MGQCARKPNKKVVKKPMQKCTRITIKQRKNKKGGADDIQHAVLLHQGMSLSLPYQQPLYYTYPMNPNRPQYIQTIQNSPSGIISDIKEQKTELSHQDVAKIKSQIPKIDTEKLNELTKDMIKLLNPSKKDDNYNDNYLKSVRKQFEMINKVLKTYKQDSAVRTILIKFLDNMRLFNNNFENLHKQLKTACEPDITDDPRYIYSLLNWPSLKRHLVYKLQSFATLIIKKIDVVVTTADDILKIKTEQYPITDNLYNIEAEIDYLMKSSSPDSSELQKLQQKKKKIIDDFNKTRTSSQIISGQYVSKFINNTKFLKNITLHHQYIIRYCKRIQWSVYALKIYIKDFTDLLDQHINALPNASSVNKIQNTSKEPYYNTVPDNKYTSQKMHIVKTPGYDNQQLQNYLYDNPQNYYNQNTASIDFIGTPKQTTSYNMPNVAAIRSINLEDYSNGGKKSKKIMNIK
jgi:hypothetical protein